MKMNKDTRQALLKLQRNGSVIAIEPLNGGHVRLTLRNGRTYTAASSASDWRAVRNMVAEIQRILRLT